MPQKAAFGPSGISGRRAVFLMQAWGDALPAFYFSCAVCSIAPSSVCHLLEQKVGSWETRTVAVSLIHEIGACSSCCRWALKWSFACLALLKTRLGGQVKQGKELLIPRGTSVLACGCCLLFQPFLEMPCAPHLSLCSVSDASQLSPEDTIVV